ncbi:MAG: DUF1467 family protein [Alphaproteobacteria bacterium]|nr:MAG: DUF1467 family protein [Alphaproteobacteria bacterium]
MTITAVIVLYAVCWFMTLFIVLPLRLTTQNDVGQVIPGTCPSAPVEARIGRKFLWTTAIATAIWAALCAVILSGVLTLADIDFFHRM